MFAWIARLLRRKKDLPGSTGTETAAIETVLPEDAEPASSGIPATSEPTAEEGPETGPVVRKLDYALLITDSGSLENLPEGERYLEMAHRHGGLVQPSVSGLTLVLFEPEEEGMAAAGRVAFARELEKKSLARIRCLHGQAMALRDPPAPGRSDPVYTLRNFHVLVQHAAALDLGKVTEAGSYHAAQRARQRKQAMPGNPVSENQADS